MTTTITPDRIEFIRPPAGAAEISDWRDCGDGEFGRTFSQTPFETLDAVLTIHGSQYDDGRVSRSVVVRIKPTFEGEDEADLTPREARKLAALLQNFADTCEILDGVER
ncbi:MAG: hypothetical protein K2X52_10100 [Mycobacteriaceae bacterium]|nr:hypothetical protein [Mycobacteriaceae bacterium]